MNQQVEGTQGTSSPFLNFSEFDRLQLKLVKLWEKIGGANPAGMIQEDNSVIVIPSLSMGAEFFGPRIHAYEQRLLFLLFLLRQPNLRLIYVTSMPIKQSIIDYYLDILPGIVYSNARKRLFFVSVDDSSPDPLSKKLLMRPYLIDQIKALVPNPDLAHVIPFLTTDLERELALCLGMPMYASDPAFVAFGTKSGSRQIFEDEGIPHPLGHEDLYSEDAIVSAVCQMRAKKPELRKIIVKLNEGISGMGNATMHLDNVPAPGSAEERTAVAEALANLQFEEPGTTYDSYRANVEQEGAIVEELISGRAFQSPSAQLRVTPLGEVEMLSTHDQILGGPTGQSYIGARFPANADYAWLIMFEAEKIGRRLAREGVLGRFAVDFVVVQDDDGRWQPYAIEINLRKGGTTAPYLTLQYLTAGNYDAQSGVFRTVRGDRKCYVSSDHVESPGYRVFTPEILFDIVSRHGLHYNHSSQTGIVMHMVSSVGGYGFFGVTAIGDTDEEADALYERFVEVMDREAAICSGS